MCMSLNGIYVYKSNVATIITSRTHAIHRDNGFGLYSNNYIVYDRKSSTNLGVVINETACIA